MNNQKVVYLLDLILDQVDDKESLLDIQDQLFKRGVETLLKSELIIDAVVKDEIHINLQKTFPKPICLLISVCL